MDTPTWALTLAYWAHMLATVVWIGGLATVFLTLPSIGHRALDERSYTEILEKTQHRLDPLGWFSAAVLVGSGLVQMSANPNYEGFLALNNRWAAAILAKHILFGLMVAVSAYLTWGLTPALRRAAFQRERDGKTTELKNLRRRMVYLLGLNLLLGVIVLGFTALARAS